MFNLFLVFTLAIGIATRPGRVARMTMTAPFIGEFGFGFTARRLLATLRRMIVFRALFAAVFPPRRFTLCFVWKVGVQLVLLGVVGGFADSWLRCLLAHIR